MAVESKAPPEGARGVQPVSFQVALEAFLTFAKGQFAHTSRLSIPDQNTLCDLYARGVAALARESRAEVMRHERIGGLGQAARNLMHACRAFVEVSAPPFYTQAEERAVNVLNAALADCERAL